MSKKSKTIKIDKPIGIYDPDGLNINPLTNKPYENLSFQKSDILKSFVLLSCGSTLVIILQFLISDFIALHFSNNGSHGKLSAILGLLLNGIVVMIVFAPLVSIRTQKPIMAIISKYMKNKNRS